MDLKFPYESWSRDVILKRGNLLTQRKKPEERSTQQMLIYGIINLDKPEGPTSHQVSAYVRDMLGIPKAGHSGTLDPGVTGVLPTGLGHAARVAQALLPAGKEYVALMHIHKEVPEEKLRAVLAKTVGKITQLPPVKSAVRRRRRQRDIYYLDILDVDGRDVLFRIGCQAGTYIRKFCFDIGQELGTGAHMQELRRTRVANFTEKDAFSLVDVRDAFHYFKQGNDKFLRKVISPVERAVEHLPKIWVLDSAIESLSHGRELGLPGVAKFETCVEPERLTAVLSLSGELVALGVAEMDSDDMLNSTNGLAVSGLKVFINYTELGL